MPLQLTNLSSDSIASSVKNLVLDNSIASMFGLTSSNASPQGFHTRFGTNSIFLPDKKSFTIRTLNFFNTLFKFDPPYSNSKVISLISQALMEKTQDDLQFFIQDIDLPSLTDDEGGEYGTGFIKGSFTGGIAKPTNRTFDITFLNTEFSLIDHCFYYWLKETMSNEWIYVNVPYTKCDIHIQLISTKTSEVLNTFVLTNCFPYKIASPNIDQTMDTAESASRVVSFRCDNIYMQSTFDSQDWQSKLKSGMLDDIFNAYAGRKITNFISKTTSKLSTKFGDSVVGKTLNKQ